MNKRKLITFVWSSIIFGCLISGIFASVAWFASANKFDVDITGSVVKEYFHGNGTGTAENPFIITRPIHYYHLVELFQRETSLGANARFGKDYLYFQVGLDLDNDGDLEVYAYDNQGIYLGTDESPRYSEVLNMAYYSGENALMPVGTSQVPFIGSFNGSANEGISIANLNIKCSEKVLVDSVETVRKTSDVGIFGFVSDLDENSNPTIIQNLNVDGLTIDLTGVDSSAATSTTDVSHTTAHSGSANVGYIAGHVQTYTSCLTQGATDSSPLCDVYVDNATIQGGAGSLCNYGYIGLVDTITGKSTTSISTIVTNLSTGTGGGQGQGDNWGGSINIKALNLRFYNMLNVTTTNGIATDDPSTHHPTASTNNTESNVTEGKTFLSKLSYHYKNSGAKNQHRYYSDDYNKLSIATYGNGNSSNTKMDNSPLNQVTLYCLEDSRTKTATHYETSNSNSLSNYSTALPGSILPLNVDTKENGYETLHSSDKGYNTGYIIGGQTGTSYSGGNSSYSNCYYYNTTVRTASSSIQYIQNSINSSSTFNNSRLEVLTNLYKAYDTSKTTAQNFARIKDSYNQNNASVSTGMSNITSGRAEQREILSTSFHSYTGARASLGNGEDGILDSASYIHGLHFLNGIVSSSAIETADNIYINSATPLDNYEFPRGSLDFNLKEKGYISFFAGSYQAASSTCDGFFSLYTVSRSTTDSGSTISSIKEIDKIYNNPDNATKTDYPYIYKLRGENTYTTGGNNTVSLSNQQIAALELQFDCEYIRHDPPLDSAIYYFEIPTNKGEYVMGNADNAGNQTGATAGAYLMYLDIAATAGEQQQATHNQENMISDSPLFTQIDFQTDTFVTNSCFNVAFVIPDGATKELFSIKITNSTVTHEGHDYFCYEVIIVNTTQSIFTISALLMDNDSIATNDYYYMYAIKYNTGTRTEYFNSNTFDGAGSGTAMTPRYSAPQQQQGGD